MRRSTIMAVLLLAGLVSAKVALAGGHSKMPQAVASVYAAAGGPLACGGTGHSWEIIVAHKSLPCGTKVRLCYPAVWTRRNGQRCVTATVRDRGPYAYGRTWDLAMATANALHFGVGVGPVGYWVLR